MTNHINLKIMNSQSIEDIVNKLERSGASLVVAPAKSGKSTNIPLRIYNEVLKKNPDGRIFVVEPTENAAKTLSNFVSRIQRKKIIGYLDENTELNKVSSKIVYMSVATLVQLMFDNMKLKNKDYYLASVIIMSNVMIDDIFVNLAQYIWQYLSLDDRRVPYLLLTSSIDGELSVIKSEIPVTKIQPKDYRPTDVIYSTFDSKAESLVEDITDTIINARRTHFYEGKFLIFVPTGQMISQIEALLSKKMKEGETFHKNIFITTEKETDVPHGEYSLVIDSCFTASGRKIRYAIKAICETRAGYSHHCKRLLTKDSYENLSAGKIGIASPERLLRVALHLSDGGIDYRNFFVSNRIPENLRKKIEKTISSLDLTFPDGTLNKKGEFASQLPLEGYSSISIYELLKVKKDILAEIIVLSIVSSCGMQLFERDFSAFKDESDLVIIANIVFEFIKTTLSLKEFAKEFKLKEKNLRQATEKADTVIAALFRIGYDIPQNITAEDPGKLVQSLESVFMKIYSGNLLKHEYGDIYSCGKNYSWQPMFPQDKNSPPSESLIPLVVEEFYTNGGMKRKVTLGHPVNDLNVGESYIDDIDKSLADL